MELHLEPNVASFPDEVKQFTTKRDYPDGDLVQASHINEIQDEIVAIETELLKKTGAVMEHNALSGRDLPECHPQYARTSNLPDFGWHSYDPKVYGWASSGTSIKAYWMDLKGAVLLNIGVSGTSTSSIAEIDLPMFAPNPYNLIDWTGFGWGTDNGVVLTTPIRWDVLQGATRIKVYKNGAKAAWTSSGRKKVWIFGYFEPEPSK